MSIALRVQGLSLKLQTLILAQISASRTSTGVVTAATVGNLFDSFSLPKPAKIGNMLNSLSNDGYLMKPFSSGSFKITPMGREAIREQLSDLDLIALSAEASAGAAPELGNALVSLVPVTLAPPELIIPLQRFLRDHPFDTNVFGMTRFPDKRSGNDDPVAKALTIARETCAALGLEFHLASDRAISDNLWTNVAGHMWASRFGIAIFEDLADKGLNHNLLIEVGAMVMSGRRCALLKDGSIEKLPTDFVGMIYKSVSLSNADSVASAVKKWVSDDLGIGTI